MAARRRGRQSRARSRQGGCGKHFSFSGSSEGITKNIHCGMAATFDRDATEPSRPRDLLVLGGGNAALCAAITAREAGLSVTLVESAPETMRGGNSRRSRNTRTILARPPPPLTGGCPGLEERDAVRMAEGGHHDDRPT